MIVLPSYCLRLVLANPLSAFHTCLRRDFLLIRLANTLMIPSCLSNLTSPMQQPGLVVPPYLPQERNLGRVQLLPSQSGCHAPNSSSYDLDHWNLNPSFLLTQLDCTTISDVFTHFSPAGIGAVELTRRGEIGPEPAKRTYSRNRLLSECMSVDSCLPRT